MTGPEHYQAAEHLLGAANRVDATVVVLPQPDVIAAAQVHATLALAAATALQHALTSNPDGYDGHAWDCVASEYAKPGPS